MKEMDERLARLRVRVLILTAERAAVITDPAERLKFSREAFQSLWLGGREPETPIERAAMEEWINETI